ncbi:5152_t:CDS:2 [Funneliformis mosseae]|uniref:5152_t:CDS:1 n=1 Tax=Funneliformis mosseae TaxID=27381 RepID=A0A9N9EBU6_FUNMO|nr:5152_t:CDS:2 [Funneliformis mosseae]
MGNYEDRKKNGDPILNNNLARDETLYYRNEKPGYNFDKSWLFYPDVYWVTHWESNKLKSGKDPLPDDYDLWVHVYDAP